MSEIEIPCVFLDGLVLDTSTDSPAYFNRDPEPGEKDVPADTLISVDVGDLSGAGLDTTSIEIYVGNVRAYDADGGGFQSGWNGPGSAVSSPDARTRRVVLDPTSDFDSLETVVVRGRAKVTGGLNIVERTWSFQIEDLTPPLLVGALAFDAKRIRITADEPLNRGAATSLASALHPENWALEGLTAPFVTVAVVAVEEVTDTVFDLLTDVELSPAATYRVTVLNVEDAHGNAFAPPANTIDVMGYQCARAPERRFDIYRMFPRINRTEDISEDLKKFSAVMQDVVDILLCDIDHFPSIADPHYAPERFVDLMLDDLGNPFDFELDLSQKRRLSVILVDIYRLKGTKPGIEDAIAFFLGIPIELRDLADQGWILGDSDLGVDTDLFPAGSFNLYAFEAVADRVLTPAQRMGIRQIIDYMKPGHTHLVRIVEPAAPTPIIHIEMGLSELGITWELH